MRCCPGEVEPAVLLLKPLLALSSLFLHYCVVQCTQSEILSVADAIVDQGLDKLGYQFSELFVTTEASCTTLFLPADMC